MGNTRKLAPIELTQDVIDKINGEFAYQATLEGSGRADARDHGVSGQLVTLLPYTLDAYVAWTKNPGDEAALDALRKVAGIALRALVVYGCPPRVIPKKRIQGGKGVQGQKFAKKLPVPKRSLQEKGRTDCFPKVPKAKGRKTAKK